MEQQDFYIGWQAAAPPAYRSFIRKYLYVVIPLITCLGILFASFQKKFGDGRFELGKPTTLKGIYLNAPLPHLKISGGNDMLGRFSSILVPLVGYGKHGAESVVRDMETQAKCTLDKREISLRGALLYSEGKLLLQVDKNEDPLVSVGPVVNDPGRLPVTRELGIHKVRGEIVDPKCFFGVMKPGEGKPHRDCAVRCILGGITPVMRARNEKGEANYFIILGPQGEKMNTAVTEYVAEPVEWEARLVAYDDWIVMYVQDPKGIRRIPGSFLSGKSREMIGCR